MTGFALPPSALDELTVEDRRRILIDLAKADDATLSMVGSQPENDPVFVVDTVDTVLVGNEVNALRAYAESVNLCIHDPVLVPGSAGLADSWVVHVSAYGADPTVLVEGDSEEEAVALMKRSLWGLSGSCVSPLRDWADLVAAGGLDELAEEGGIATTAPAAPKPSQFLVSRWLTLKALPVAAVGPHIAHHEGEAKIRRKAAMAVLEAPSGMSTMPGGGTLPSAWSLRTLEDAGVRYANHHDLLAALRMGLDIEDVQPWPNDVAHRFLVHEELKRSMNVRGYVEITDFDPKKRPTLRVSLPEFTPSITGDKPPEKVKELRQEKPVWPPAIGETARVVIILDAARLAYDIEPDWEAVALRTPMECTGCLWVEREGPFERRRRAPAKRKATKAGEKLLTPRGKAAKAAQGVPAC